MKTKSITLAAAVLCIAADSQAAIIQQVAGPITATEGNNVNIIFKADNTDLDDWMDTTAAGGTFYFGFDIVFNPETDGAGGGFFGLLEFAAPGPTVGFGNAWGGTNLGLGGTGGSQAGAYTVGQTERVVIRLDIDTAGDATTVNDEFSFYFNPASATEGTPDGTFTSRNFENFDRITLRSGNGTGSTTVSNFIVASDFASAVPEPSTALLGAIGFLALLRRRR